ncbi:hypothetical protein AYI68_g7902, partial [Smittium mucronatum]
MRVIPIYYTCSLFSAIVSSRVFTETIIVSVCKAPVLTKTLSFRFDSTFEQIDVESNYLTTSVYSKYGTVGFPTTSFASVDKNHVSTLTEKTSNVPNGESGISWKTEVATETSIILTYNMDGSLSIPSNQASKTYFDHSNFSVSEKTGNSFKESSLSVGVTSIFIENSTKTNVNTEENYETNSISNNSEIDNEESHNNSNEKPTNLTFNETTGIKATYLENAISTSKSVQELDSSVSKIIENENYASILTSENFALSIKEFYSSGTEKIYDIISATKTRSYNKNVDRSSINIVEETPYSTRQTNTDVLHRVSYSSQIAEEITETITLLHNNESYEEYNPSPIFTNPIYLFPSTKTKNQYEESSNVEVFETKMKSEFIEGIDSGYEKTNSTPEDETLIFPSVVVHTGGKYKESDLVENSKTSSETIMQTDNVYSYEEYISSTVFGTITGPTTPTYYQSRYERSSFSPISLKASESLAPNITEGMYSQFNTVGTEEITNGYSYQTNKNKPHEESEYSDSFETVDKTDSSSNSRNSYELYSSVKFNEFTSESFKYNNENGHNDESTIKTYIERPHEKYTSTAIYITPSKSNIYTKTNYIIEKTNRSNPPVKYSILSTETSDTISTVKMVGSTATSFDKTISFTITEHNKNPILISTTTTLNTIYRTHSSIENISGERDDESTTSTESVERLKPSSSRAHSEDPILESTTSTSKTIHKNSSSIKTISDVRDDGSTASSYSFKHSASSRAHSEDPILESTTSNSTTIQKKSSSIKMVSDERVKSSTISTESVKRSKSTSSRAHSEDPILESTASTSKTIHKNSSSITTISDVRDDGSTASSYSFKHSASSRAHSEDPILESTTS